MVLRVGRRTDDGGNGLNSPCGYSGHHSIAEYLGHLSRVQHGERRDTIIVKPGVYWLGSLQRRVRNCQVLGMLDTQVWLVKKGRRQSKGGKAPW